MEMAFEDLLYTGQEPIYPDTLAILKAKASVAMVLTRFFPDFAESAPEMLMTHNTIDGICHFWDCKTGILPFIQVNATNLRIGYQ